MARSVIWRHDASLRHDTGAHPERAARIVAIERALDAGGAPGWDRRDSPRASAGAVEAVHPRFYVEGLERLCARGGGAIDADTLCSEHSLEAALHAAGGAVAMVDELLGGSTTGAAVHRPPGHHALEQRAMGFCLLNSVAIAARHARAAGIERVMILDWDVHHGNGTNDIFHADPDVLFVSIHQSPLWPGSGAETDEGSGAGVGATVNLPVAPGSGDAVFGSLVEHVAMAVARVFHPGLVLISAGFDAHRDDALAECSVSTAGYAGMAASVRRTSAQLGVPVGLVLEGGYDLDALAASLIASLDALGAAPMPAPALAVDPTAARALARLARHWPLTGARAAPAS